MNLNCVQYKKWFLNYVKEYGDSPEVILKRDHSLRVAANMKRTFKEFELQEEYVYLAEFIGLFHDIGRFEQWRIYETFFDNISVDHADFSVETLFDDEFIRHILSEKNYDSIIYNAIKYHNKLALPEYLNVKDESVFRKNIGLNEVLKSLKNEYVAINSLYSMAIRDADKIDILKQYILSDYLLKSDDIPVTTKVSNSFFSNQPINKEDRKTLNDTLILRLSFINDINLTSFLKIIRDDKLIEEINNVYPNKEVVQPYFDYALERLDELIQNNKETQYVLKK